MAFCSLTFFYAFGQRTRSSAIFSCNEHTKGPYRNIAGLPRWGSHGDSLVLQWNSNSP